MTSSSIETAAQWLGKLALQEVEFLGEVGSKVEELKSELEWMQCFLMDADEKQNKNVVVRKWVSEIRDLAFSAEDLIESYILKVKYQRQDGFINYLKWLTLFWMDAFTLHDIGSDLDALTAKISKLTSRLQSYGVKSSYDAHLSHVLMTKKLLAEQRRTYSHVEEHDIVGLQDCVSDLTSELLGPNKKVVVVHGMGGIGKSTLARELFHHSPLKDRFAGFAWGYISQQLQLGPVCREILLQLIPESASEERIVIRGLQDALLPGKLYNMLKQQNYLIVLDDVWFVGDWLSLAPIFPLHDHSCGSRLLITTRNRDILRDLDDLVFYYEVKLLNREISWELLQRKAIFRKDGSAAQWLGKLALQEVEFLGEVGSKVEELKSELEWMQCFLMDADEKQNKNVVVRKWVSEIRDLAFSAEDLIESYILKVKYQRQDGFINYLKWLTLFWMDAFTLHDIGSDLDALTAKISKLTSRLQSYGVKSSYDAHLSHVLMTKKLLAEQRRTYSHVEEHDIVGLQDCVSDLTSELLGPNKKVVVVHGMGGIGKSTLARELFHHSPLKDRFAGFAWGYISQQLQLGPVCREILLQLIPESASEERIVIRGLQDALLPGKLYNMLKQQNYLIVLDDVWFVGDWLSLAPIFPLHDHSCGSRLLITTRNRDILRDLDDLVFYYEVKLLNREISWELLQRKAIFRKDGSDPLMIELGEKMLDHCNGHPFAIAVLGGVLATKKSLDEWQSVFDNLTFYLRGNESLSGVYDVLGMSYDELPYNAKPCFLHLVNFPEDYEIPLEKLYHLWIADGIFSSTQEQITQKGSLEEIAEVYLMELVQKGMVQLGARYFNGLFTTCHLHDLMRDKGLEIVKQEIFLQIIDDQPNVNVQRQASKEISCIKTLRRLTVYVGPEMESSILKALSGKSSNLRSLVFFSPAGEDSKQVNCEWMLVVCEEFQLLRVFDLEGLNLTGSLPNEIGNLIYLRYLSLKGTQVTKLPSSICNLNSLLILDLRVKGTIMLPNLLWRLESLKQLYLPSRHISQAVTRDEPYRIEDNTTLVLDNMFLLEKLEGLNLDNLDDLGLDKLSSLRKVSASCVSKKDILEPFLKSPSIKHLHLSLDARILEAHPMVLSTCSALQVLYLDGEMYSRLPVRPRMYHQNLVQLDISYCTMEADPMPVLQTLPKLLSLGLHVCYQEMEMVCSLPNAFPELTYLAFDGLFTLKKWTVTEGGLAKLRTLYIGNTPIETLPQVLPTEVAVSCSPCVGGTRRYGGCTHVNANRSG